jgi:hypothetical protein
MLVCRFKKRPFHRQAREHYINCHFVFLEQISTIHTGLVATVLFNIILFCK